MEEALHWLEEQAAVAAGPARAAELRQDIQALAEALAAVAATVAWRELKEVAP